MTLKIMNRYYPDGCVVVYLMSRNKPIVIFPTTINLYIPMKFIIKTRRYNNTIMSLIHPYENYKY